MKRSFQHVSNLDVHANTTLASEPMAVTGTSQDSIDYGKPRKQRMLYRITPTTARHVHSTTFSRRSDLVVALPSSLALQRKCSDFEALVQEEALLDLVLSFLNVREHHIIRKTSRSWRRRVQTMNLDALDLSARILPLNSHTFARACPSILQTYSHLRRLDVSSQRYLSDRDLLVLTSCFWIHLEEIIADDCLEISDFGLLAVLNAQSLRLQSLSVRHCKKITGTLFASHVSQLTGSHPELVRLDLDDTSVTWPFISRLEAYFPTLQYLSALHTPAHRTFFQQSATLNVMLRELQLVVSSELVELPLLPALLDAFNQWGRCQHKRKLGVFERTLVASGTRGLLDVPLLFPNDSLEEMEENGSSVFLSPLLYACASGKTRILSTILAAQQQDQRKGGGVALDLENTDVHGHSALSLAVGNGFTEATRLLVRAGSDINTLSLTLASPLYIASEHGCDLVVDMLLDANARRDTLVKDGTTAFGAAAKNGHRSTVLRLLAAEKQAQDEEVHALASGMNRNQLVQALFLACEGGHVFVVSDLLLLTELDANMLLDENVSPLYLACQMGHVDIVALLLARGANPNFRRPHGGVSCLYIAAQEGHDEIVTLLVTKGAKVDLKMDDLSTALHIAARMGRKAVAKALLTCGAHLNDQTRSGLTPLYIASEEGHVNLVQLFVRVGAACDLQTNSGATALFVAVHQGHKAVVKALLVGGANAAIAKHNGTSPLDAATLLGDIKIAKLLLRFGARVGGLALHFAERQRDAVDFQTLLRSCYFTQHFSPVVAPCIGTNIPPTIA